MYSFDKRAKIRKVGTWIVRSLYMADSLIMVAKELSQHFSAITRGRIGAGGELL
jgi:hypothetical protein